MNAILLDGCYLMDSTPETSVSSRRKNESDARRKGQKIARKYSESIESNISRFPKTRVS